MPNSVCCSTFRACRFQASSSCRWRRRLEQVFATMAALEKGAIANPKRMVGHYWLRAPQLAPNPHKSKETRGILAKYAHTVTSASEGAVTDKNLG